MFYTVTTTALNATTSLLLLDFHTQDAPETVDDLSVASGTLLNPDGNHVVFLDSDGGATQSLFNHLKGKQIPKEISIISPIYGGTYDRILHLQKNSVCTGQSIRGSTPPHRTTTLESGLAATGPYCTGDSRIELIFTDGNTLPLVTSEEDFRAECMSLRDRGVSRMYLSQKAAEVWMSGICGPEYSPGGSVSSFGPLMSSPPIPIIIFSKPHNRVNGQMVRATFPVALSRRLFGRPHTTAAKDRTQHLGIQVANATVQSIVGCVNGAFRLTSDNNARTTIDPCKNDQYIMLAVHHDEGVEDLSVEISGCISPQQEAWTNVDSILEMRFPGVPPDTVLELPIEEAVRHVMDARVLTKDSCAVEKLPLLVRAEAFLKVETQLSSARLFLCVWEQALFMEDQIIHPLTKLFHRIVQDLSTALGGGGRMVPGPMRQTSGPVNMMM